MKLLIFVVLLVSAFGFNRLNGKMRKSEEHGGYCEMEFKSDDDSEYRDELYYSYHFAMTQTDKNEGEFVAANSTGIACVLGGDHDFFEDYDVTIWKTQDDLRCFKFKLFGGSAIYDYLTPGEDYFVDEKCFGGFEYFSEIDKGCKLYWKPEFFSLRSTLKIAFTEGDWDSSDQWYENFESAIDNDGGNQDLYIDAYTLDGDECVGGEYGFATTFSLFGLISLLLIS